MYLGNRYWRSDCIFRIYIIFNVVNPYFKYFCKSCLKLNKIVVYYLKRRYCSTKLYINSVISFVTVIKIKLWLKTAVLRTKPKLIYFSGNQQSIISFINIKNWIRNIFSLNCKFWMRKVCGFIWRMYYNNFRLSRSDLTSVSCHVTVNFQRVSTMLRVDPVLPVSFRITRVPDVLTGISRLLWIPASLCCSR